MVHPVDPYESVLNVLSDLHEASRAAAKHVAEVAKGAVASRGRFCIALAGGGTPRHLYSLLANDYRNSMPWPHTHVFWGDERWVPHGHPHSNFTMAHETLLRHVPVPPDQVHPMPTDLRDPDAAACAYEAKMHRCFEGKLPRFDLVLLGLGSDGHTASLFPHSPVLAETCRWALPSEAPAEPKQRLTLTLPVLCNAACVVFLVYGAGKRAALKMALDGSTDPALCPAAAVRPHSGQLHFCADEAAAPD